MQNASVPFPFAFSFCCIRWQYIFWSQNEFGFHIKFNAFTEDIIDWYAFEVFRFFFHAFQAKSILFYTTIELKFCAVGSNFSSVRKWYAFQMRSYSKWIKSKEENIFMVELAANCGKIQ